MYGSREWLEMQYSATSSDPWGLDWRPSQRYRYEVMLEALRRALSAGSAPQRIVDVGCATGTFTGMLASLAPNGNRGVTGIDIAQRAIERAQIRNPQADFHCMSLVECAQRYAGGADLVTCLEVLYYIDRSQRRDALLKLKSMLRTGGLLLVSSMISRGPYMSVDELDALVGSELAVVDRGVLFLRPLTLVEKLLMRLRRGRENASGGDSRFSESAVRRLEMLSRVVFGRAAMSHAYVLARRN